MKASNISPAQYWGKFFINSANRQKVVLVSYIENIEELKDSTIFISDSKGRLLTPKGIRWDIFCNTYVPSMLNDYQFKLEN